jgi:hypothetical protein
MVLLGLSGWSTAGDTYYRWIDASGTEVNSDRPPPAGVEYETIATSTNNRVDEIPDRENATGVSDPGQSGTQGNEAAPEQRYATKKDPEACTIARQNLETLKTHARIRMPDGEGSFRYLSEDEKAAERAKAEAAIKQNCE